MVGDIGKGLGTALVIIIAVMLFIGAGVGATIMWELQ